MEKETVILVIRNFNAAEKEDEETFKVLTEKDLKDGYIYISP